MYIFLSYVSAARRCEKQEKMWTKSTDLTLKSEKRIGLLGNTELFLQGFLFFFSLENHKLKDLSEG